MMARWSFRFPITLAALAALAAVAAGAPLGAPLGAQQSDGKTIYLKNCRQCHGVTGVPSKQNVAKYPTIKTFADPGFFTGRNDDSLRTVVKNGAGKDMLGFAGKLSETEIAAVVEYLHVLAKHERKP